MRLRKALVAAGCLSVALASGCGSGTPLPIVTVRLTVGTTTLELRAEVAATPADRDRGLMGRRSLAKGTGMLFVFPDRAVDGFWMKDTLIPLDIAFIESGRVVEIDSMTPCRADPCPITRPPGPYHQAIEANPGAFSGLSVGADLIIVGSLTPAS